LTQFITALIRNKVNSVHHSRNQSEQTCYKRD